MKLYFHWPSIITASEIYAWQHSHKFINSYLRRGAIVNLEKLYIITDDRKGTYMRLNKYKQILKKL